MCSLSMTSNACSKVEQSTLSSSESETDALKVGVVAVCGLQGQPYRKDACAVKDLDLMW